MGVTERIQKKSDIDPVENNGEQFYGIGAFLAYTPEMSCFFLLKLVSFKKSRYK
jgi:hypothetical protein